MDSTSAIMSAAIKAIVALLPLTLPEMVNALYNKVISQIIGTSNNIDTAIIAGVMFSGERFCIGGRSAKSAPGSMAVLASAVVPRKSTSRILDLEMIKAVR